MIMSYRNLLVTLMKIYKIRYSSKFNNESNSVFIEQMKIISMNKKIKTSFSRSGKASFEIEFSNTSDRQWANIFNFSKLRALN